MKGSVHRENDEVFYDQELFESKKLAHRFRFKNKKKICDLCGMEFRACSKFDFFCKACRAEDEVYRFHDWAS